MGDSNSEACAGAAAALQAFVDANGRGDGEAMVACLSKKSIESGGFTGPQGGVTFSLGEPAVEGEMVIIPLLAKPDGAPEDQHAGPALQAVMVKEDGAWKFDLATSQERMMGAIEEAMGQMASAMGEAMGGAMDGIAEAMSEAFGGDESEELPAQSWEDASLELSSGELHSLPEMETLERLQQAMTEAVGFPVSVKADLAGLLSLAGSEDRQLLVDWLEQQLLVAWPSYVGTLAQQMQLSERLHGIRIEGAASATDRFIAVDLNDVVYRMYPADEAGYYSDDEVLRVLAGVLAGLPASMGSGSGVVTVFPEYDVESGVNEYVSLAAPRCMRRISEMLGRNIALEAEWDDIGYVQGASSVLLRWGLQRVVGGVALAMMDEYLGGRLRDDLKKIRFRCEYLDATRRLSYEDGVLEFAPALAMHEMGCFWEADVEAALAGTPILPPEGASTDANESMAYATEAMESTDEVVNNDTLFADAVAALEGAVPTWQMQVEMALGHPTPLVVDWSSLDGRYDLVQGMVHVGVVESLGAISAVGFDPATKKALADAVQLVKIVHVTGVSPGERVQLEDGRLLFLIDAAQEVTGPPDGSLARELRRALGIDTPEPTAVEAEPAPAGIAASAAERGQSALAYMARLEELMREAQLWPGDAPEGKLEVRGAFGCENMAFEQWLAWVLIPRVKAIVEAGDTFPNGSMVGTYAVRALDGAQADEVIGLLYEFDRFIDTCAGGRA